MKRLVTIVILAALAGCVAPRRESSTLDERQIEKLRKQTRLPQDAGVVVTENKDGTVWIDHAKKFSGATEVELELNTRPFRRARLPIVRAHINGKVILALVDTGTTVSLIDYWGALRVDATPLGPDFIIRQAQSPGGTMETILGMVDELSLDDLRLARVPIGIMNDSRGMAFRGWLEGFRTEMILGNDLLSSFAWVRFDMPGERIRFSRSGPYQPDTKHLVGTVPLATRFGVPVMLVMIEGQGPVPVALDTGMDSGLWLSRPMANKLHFPELEDPGNVRMGQSVSGRSPFKPVRPRTVEFVDFSIPDVPTIVNLIQGGNADPPYALMGQEVFGRYVVTVDYKSRKVFFEQP